MFGVCTLVAPPLPTHALAPGRNQIAAIRGDAVDAGYGAQTRNYVLHPYKVGAVASPSFVRRAALVGKSSRIMPSFVAATT